MDPINELEANFIGCLLKDSSLIDEVVITPAQLTTARHREWFKIIVDFHKDNQYLDFITLLTIKPEQLEAIGGSRYMVELMEGVPSIHAFKSYQDAILNAFNVQRAKDIAVDFLQNVGQFGKPESLMGFIEQVTRLETSTNKKIESFKSRLMKRMEEHMDAPVNGFSGVDTGFTHLNRLTDGWRNKDLIVLGGRPSMGKTAFGLATLLQGMLNDKEVYPTFMSAEMPEGGIIDRLIAQYGKLNLSVLRNINKYMVKEEDQRKYNAATTQLAKSNFEMFEESTVPAIRARMRQRIKEYPGKKHICCIDFLTQLRPINPSGNANYDYGAMVLDIKQMAKDLNVPVILLVQLNRQNENRENKRPTMADIRDTGTVEQAGDFIGFIHREDYYNRDQEPTNIAELIIAKNRQGQTGTVRFEVNLKTQSFYDYGG